MMPTPGFTLPKAALPLYCSVGQVVPGCPSYESLMRSGFSFPSPGGGSKRVALAIVSG